MSGETLTPATVLVAHEEVLSSEFDEEAVMLDLRTGIYYGLEGAGARIWQLLQRPVTLAHLEEAIQREYAVEPDRCRRDLAELVEKLLERGLIRIAGAPATG